MSEMTACFTRPTQLFVKRAVCLKFQTNSYRIVFTWVNSFAGTLTVSPMGVTFGR